MVLRIQTRIDVSLHIIFISATDLKPLEVVLLDEQSDLELYCLPRPFCLNTCNYGKYCNNKNEEVSNISKD